MKLTIDCPCLVPHRGSDQLEGWLPRDTTIQVLEGQGAWVPLNCDPEKGGCDSDGVAHVTLRHGKLQVRFYKLEEI